MDIERLKQKYDKAKKRWEEKEKIFKEKRAEKEHDLSDFKNLAVLHRTGAYRNNCFFYIRDTRSRKNRRAVYDATLAELQDRLYKIRRKPRKTSTPAQHAARYRFEFHDSIELKGKLEKLHNFLYSKWPYPQEAHHLLPAGVFSDKYFNPSQMELMLKMPYDLNHGENMIFLPRSNREARIHRLPIHRQGNVRHHSGYNDLVSEDIREIADALKMTGEEECKPGELPDVMSQLIKCQSDYWEVVVGWGPEKNLDEAGKAEVAARAARPKPDAIS